MCIDEKVFFNLLLLKSGRIYLFGGWEGSKDLCDFWYFDEVVNEWNCISMDTRKYSFFNN